ncbi:MFS transporter [Amycolatopsis cihanbeyliensis]|uniref:Putative MFS family arabinose efflux permease n=1 Tax=Amycolatopsis cihanbeyliensis TaxID=1128664 RepID=A0A542CU29_AMYCI|nr:MFS transporter [Amycolatopsis cihanbeyliensis]TQI94329.1 putative MFS family arabinose efflux permease [Amycolatopsis cihanbeyliensis]
MADGELGRTTTENGPEQGVLQRASRGRPWLTLVATVLGGVLVGLDGTATTIAAPYISAEVGATLGELELIANAYLVALAIALLPAGRLADRIGRRRTFVLGVLLFGLASLGIALSGTVTALVLFRVLQGLAGALLQPAALALLRNAFPPGKLGLPLGVWGGVNALAIGLGPVIGGVIVQGFSWEAVFLLNVPVAAVVIGLTFWAVVESKGAPKGVPGALRGLLRRRAVTLGAALVGFSSFGVFGLLFLLTLYLQNARGLPPIQAGAWMLPPTCVVVLSAPLGGLLAQRFGPRWPVSAGLLLVAAGLFSLAGLGTTSGFVDLLLPGALVGFGTGLCVIAATEAILGASPEESSGSASALQQMATQIGGVLGIAAVGTMMSWQVLRTIPVRIEQAGLPEPVADAVLRDTDAVAQGTVPAVLDGVEGSLGHAVQAVARLGFTDAMGVAMVLLAGVTLVGAVAALWLPRPAQEPDVRPEPEEPEPAGSATR